MVQYTLWDSAFEWERSAEILLNKGGVKITKEDEIGEYLSPLRAFRIVHSCWSRMNHKMGSNSIDTIFGIWVYDEAI
jgi:hypothetical protein